MESVLRDPAPDSVAHLGSVTLLAPIQRPPKLICIGLNYHDHAVESGLAVPTIPVVFNKFTNVVIGPNVPIVLPRISEKPDYEVELAVVIGKGEGISLRQTGSSTFSATRS